MKSVEWSWPFGFGFAYDFLAGWQAYTGPFKFKVYDLALVLRIGPHRMILFFPVKA